MISGHGDDGYQYRGITMNFSSNIPAHTDLTALKAHLAQRLDLIATYPEPEAWSLERLIARQHGIGDECVVVTSGATEAIYLVAQTFRNFHHHISEPTFREYRDSLTAEVPTGAVGGTAFWLCNPNNPTGTVLSRQEVRSLAAQYDLVVIDQSYEGYTSVPLLAPREAVAAGNVVQLHSLTKAYGVPGLRIGYIVTSATLAHRLRRQLRPWSVNALAIEAGRFLLQHATPIRPDLAEAQRLWHALQAIEGISVQPTQTNFMLCTISGHTASQLKEHLASHHGILIRDASNFQGLTPHHFRVAAQLPSENDALVSAIGHYLNL